MFVKPISKEIIFILGRTGEAFCQLPREVWPDPAGHGAAGHPGHACQVRDQVHAAPHRQVPHRFRSQQQRRPRVGAQRRHLERQCQVLNLFFKSFVLSQNFFLQVLRIKIVFRFCCFHFVLGTIPVPQSQVICVQIRISYFTIQFQASYWMQIWIQAVKKNSIFIRFHPFKTLDVVKLYLTVIQNFSYL